MEACPRALIGQCLELGENVNCMLCMPACVPGMRGGFPNYPTYYRLIIPHFSPFVFTLLVSAKKPRFGVDEYD